MAETAATENVDLANKQPKPGKTIALEVAVPENADTVTCPVCGHANAKDAGLCAMCSNYLFN